MFEDFDNYLEQSIYKEFAGQNTENNEQKRADAEQSKKDYLSTMRLRIAFFEFQVLQKAAEAETY